jgi:hypothetical protein
MQKISKHKVFVGTSLILSILLAGLGIYCYNLSKEIEDIEFRLFEVEASVGVIEKRN